MPKSLTLLHQWFEEVWNKGRAEAIAELMAPDAVVHGIADGTGAEMRGPAAFLGFFHSFRGAFPDIHVAIEDSIASDDLIAVRCVATGTHTGDTLGFAATGKKVTFTGMCFIRLKDGQLAEGWNNFDFLSLYQQLGVQPPPPSGA